MASKISKDYSVNVFINCPFDDSYKYLFDALVFAVLSCRFIPRCAQEYNDSDDIRIQKINKLIADCQFGIHDLSLNQPRFNMPLELGIFIGCQQFGNPQQKRKKYLILENEPYQSKKFISDIAGQDLKAHQNQEINIIRAARDWLYSKTNHKIPSGSLLHEQYISFKTDLPELCKFEKLLVNELTFGEYSALAIAWLELESENS